MTLNGVTALILRFFADFDFFAGQICRSGWIETYIVRKYCLSVPVFHFWPLLTHPAARSLCDSWATCYHCSWSLFIYIYLVKTPLHDVLHLIRKQPHPLMWAWNVTHYRCRPTLWWRRWMDWNSTKLCHMFWNEPGLKMDARNVRGSLPLKRGAQALPIIGWFYYDI